VQAGVVELVAQLPPGVVEDVRALPGGVQDHLVAHLERLGLAALGVHLHGLAVGQEEDELAVGRQLHGGLPRVELRKQLGLVRAEFLDPQVVPLFEAGEVEELLAVLGQEPVPCRRRMHRQPGLPLRKVRPVEGQILGRRLFCGIFAIRLLFRLLLLGRRLLLGLLLLLLQQGEFLLRKLEPVEGGLREEHRVDVAADDSAALLPGAMPGGAPDHHRAIH